MSPPPRRPLAPVWPPAWRLDAGLAGELAAVLAWAPDDGVPALVGAVAGRVVAGSTAKLDAVAAGRLPPGADAPGLARRLVADAESGAPSPAWSCWVTGAVTAALVESTGMGHARLAAVRRAGPRAPAVDLHAAVVVVDDGTAGWLCDPYFSAVLPAPGAAELEGTGVGTWGIRQDLPDGRWAYRLGSGRWAHRLHYRSFAPALAPTEVAALCAVSVTHTGVAPARFARLARADAVTEALEHGDGTTTLRRWCPRVPGAVWAGTSEERAFPRWGAAADAFGEATGVPLR